jgi:hypothetical protein
MPLPRGIAALVKYMLAGGRSTADALLTRFGTSIEG